MRVTVNIFVFIFLYTFSFSQQQKDSLTLFFEIDQHSLTQAHTEIIDSFIQTKNIVVAKKLVTKLQLMRYHFLQKQEALYQ